MNPDTRMVKDRGRPSTRIRLGKEICRNCKLKGDNQVKLQPHIEIVEHVYNCIMYIMYLDNIPILGSSVSLMVSECLMYVREHRNNKHYVVLLRRGGITYAKRSCHGLIPARKHARSH